MTFKYIAVPAGTSECPIPCRVHITQRVEQMWAACPCPRLTRALRPSGAEGEAGARRPPAGPPLSILSSGQRGAGGRRGPPGPPGAAAAPSRPGRRRLREPAVPGPGRARVRGGRGAQRPLPFSAPPRRARRGPARAGALRESWRISARASVHPSRRPRPGLAALRLRGRRRGAAPGASVGAARSGGSALGCGARAGNAAGGRSPGG